MHKIEKTKHGPCDTFKYDGIPVLQVFGVENGFTELSKLKTFKTIIEIGTDYGGLTRMLADHSISDTAQLYTFDIRDDRYRDNHPKIKFYHQDIFQSLSLVKRLLDAYPGFNLVLCDGGNKRDEWRTIEPLLHSGDIIMAHDYAANLHQHEENVAAGRWNWWEFDDTSVTGKMIKPTDAFDKYVWCIRQKK